MNQKPLAIRREVALSEYTTLELGGPARHFFEATEADEIPEALAWAQNRKLPVCPIGGGSNIVVADTGVPGLVLRLATRGLRRQAVPGGEIWDIAAGENWDDVAAASVAAGLAGIECLSGIPGSCGAAPIQNIGAYGQEISEVLLEVAVLEIPTGRAAILAANDLDLSYRHSRLKREAGRWIVTGLKIRLRSNSDPALRYPELEAAVRARGTATLASCRAAVLELRRSKSMVLDPTDPNRRSAGSFFLNPIVSEAEFGALDRKAREKGLPLPDAGIPSFPDPDGRRKIPAAWLIEQSGFPKGLTAGGVGLSSRHTLALVHHGGGRTEELLDLAREIRQGVFRQFGVSLEAEPVLLGFLDAPWEEKGPTG